MTSPLTNEERDGLVEQLRGDLAACRARRDAWRQGFDERSALVGVQAAEITRLRAEVERKDEALKPFAESERGLEITIDDLRRARAARMPAEGRAALEQEGG